MGSGAPPSSAKSAAWATDRWWKRDWLIRSGRRLNTARLQRSDTGWFENKCSGRIMRWSRAPCRSMCLRKQLMEPCVCVRRTCLCVYVHSAAYFKAMPKGTGWFTVIRTLQQSGWVVGRGLFFKRPGTWRSEKWAPGRLLLSSGAGSAGKGEPEQNF